MKNRCYNPKYAGYHNYGGRGIKVCDRWLDKKHGFENFLADMGMRPDGMTLDRKDNDGDYEPGNCRWATASVQSNNRRCNKRIIYNGEDKTRAQWAHSLDISMSALDYRIQNWTLERALNTPAGNRNRINKK
jgi:hypothetical protein